VKDFASDNATVVVGTVIDQDMKDEVRVTVVATGLGSEHSHAVEPVRAVHLQSGSAIDYRALDRPTIIRNRMSDNADKGETNNPDYLDIPAFLRRQAD
jgi:cell division protein FtsZ